jgi:hypothetical protein
MAKPFDAATKDLIGWRPADYLALAGLPVPADPAGVVMLDTELSTTTAAADKIIRVEGVAGGPTWSWSSSSRATILGWTTGSRCTIRWPGGVTICRSATWCTCSTAAQSVAGRRAASLAPG